jgi:hypothetical protein
MAKKSTITLSTTTSGDGISTTYVPPGAPIVNNTAPAGGPIQVALSAGDNTLTVPSGATSLLIVPDAASVIVKTLKGIGGDTGFTIAPAAPTLLGLPAGATTVLLNASAGETVTVEWL